MYTTAFLEVTFLVGSLTSSSGMDDVTFKDSVTTAFTSEFSRLERPGYKANGTLCPTSRQLAESHTRNKSIFPYTEPPDKMDSLTNGTHNRVNGMLNTLTRWTKTTNIFRQASAENSTILPAIAAASSAASYSMLTTTIASKKTTAAAASTTLSWREALDTVYTKVRPGMWRVNLTFCGRYDSYAFQHYSDDGGLEMSYSMPKDSHDSITCFLSISVNHFLFADDMMKFLTMEVRNFSLTTDSGECVKNASYARLIYNDEYRQQYESEPCTGPFTVTFGQFDSPTWHYVYLTVLINQGHLTTPSNMLLSLTIFMHHTRTRAEVALSHVQTNSTGGYLTNFLFDGHLLYSRYLYAGFIIKISTQILVTSFTHFHINCQDAYLALVRRMGSFSLSHYSLGFSYAKNHQLLKTAETTWKRCGMWNEGPHVFDNSVVMVFDSGAGQPYTGFRMLYSIHNVTQAPTQPDSGLFNCSVAYYHTFQQHLQCNLEVQCQDGEDERDCPYTTDACGPGNIDAGNKCYTFFRVNTDTSWFDANDYCVERGMKLISPQTPQEFDKFKEILTFTMNSSQFFVGLRTSDLNAMYAEVWQWTDGTSAFYNMIDNFDRLSKPQCAYVKPLNRDRLHAIPCGTLMRSHNNGFMHVLCETSKDNLSSSETPQVSSIKGYFSDSGKVSKGLAQCPNGHFVKDFLSCDRLSQCGVKTHRASCQTQAGEFVAMYVCDGTSQTLPYTLVCNHRRDCADGSDESFCVHPKCLERQCKNKQCVTYDQWCDGMQHCVDGSDEICRQYVTGKSLILPPAVVNFNRLGGYTLSPMAPNDTCPVTHVRCSDGFCIPVYLRCNGVYDCLGHEDETGCDGYQCPGLYRCRASSVCVHTNHVCDGVFQCPQQDDELLCNLTCPEGCGCQGSAFVCTKPFPAASHPDLRYLDASGSGMTPDDLATNFYLVSVTLSRCGLKHLPSMTFRNLRTLDLSANHLRYINIHVFQGCVNLRELRLSRNPINILREDGIQTVFQHVHTLDLSETDVAFYDSAMLSNFPFLQKLNVSYTAIKYVAHSGFNSTPHLKVIDANGCPLDDFPHDILRSLTSLQTVYASNYKLCCLVMLPEDFNVRNCHAPKDDIASCDDLLRSNTYRVCLWIMALLAVTGNIGSLVTRLYIQKKSSPSSFNVFVTNLNVADLVMGIYLGIVGTADLMFRGVYLWQDKVWKTSAVCKMAGFLSLLSSEMSAFLICLITLDRLLALRFIFSGFRFSTRSAIVACAILWAAATTLSMIPLVPLTTHWEFYGQNGICLPLPVTRKQFEGHAYAFGIMILLNMTIFLLIAVGQILIYNSVQKNSITSEKNASKDATIARRLSFIVLSDFLCWFPIGLLGLLASKGTSISSEVNVAMAIFVLPLNSALNPFLYTLNIAIERRRKVSEAQMLEQLARKLASQRQVMDVETMTSTVDQSM